MASRKLEDLDIRLQEVWLLSIDVWKLKYPDLTPFLTCTYRSNQEQDELYAQGRTAPGNIVTNAKAGQSKHNSFPSQAWDMAFKRPDGSVDWSVKHYRNFAKIVASIAPELIWGGTWKSVKDYPHWELLNLEDI